MFVVVQIGGKQFKVEENKYLYVDRLDKEEGGQIAFEQVLLVENGGATRVGTPFVSGARVTATVENHLKGDKVIIFKKRKRKGYQIHKGHRQALTRLKINAISV